MKKLLYDLSEFVDILTPEAEALKLAERFAKRRKEKKLTQRKAAQLACVSYSSLRRFENTGEISLRSLLRIAYAIGYIHDFEKVFPPQPSPTLKRYDDTAKTRLWQPPLRRR